MAIKVFADGANLEGMLDMYENGNVQGFTTNPSLMKKGGVTDYRAFAKEVLAHIADVSVSFEVFADDVETMEVEAREIATWAENVYVKIPCVTTKGESTAELVRKLSADGIKVNVTTIFTPEQVDEMVEAVDAETPSIISLFAGRIADTGVDPIPFMTESVKKAAAKPNCEVLWASTRELINIYQAEACGCQIITVPNSILAKRKIEAAYQAANRPIDNVKIMSTDIERIKGVITAEDEVSRIYINFCNPWSKNGSSHKHRLTYPRQLINYRAFLKDGGEIYFKTDDDDLFRDSLEYFPASGYDIEWMTYDLHENEPEWNIRTEHEGMFTEMGIKIKALIARKDPDPASVTWIEPKILKRQAREAAEAEAAAKAAQEGEGNE